MKTLIARGHREFAGVTYHHGSEIPSGVLPPEIVDKWIDWRWLDELNGTERRSLYRMFPAFSGCNESESLTSDELDELTLPA